MQPYLRAMVSRPASNMMKPMRSSSMTGVPKPPPFSPSSPRGHRRNMNKTCTQIRWRGQSTIPENQSWINNVTLLNEWSDGWWMLKMHFIYLYSLSYVFFTLKACSRAAASPWTCGWEWQSHWHPSTGHSHSSDASAVHGLCLHPQTPCSPPAVAPRSLCTLVQPRDQQPDGLLTYPKEKTMYINWVTTYTWS